jgi:hypothetical protein
MWHAVEPEEEDVVEYHDDRLTFTMILRAVLPEMLASLVTKRMSQSAWEAIKSRCIGVQRVRDTNGEQLQKDFDNIRFKDGESVDDFLMWLTGLTNNITALGGKISELDIMKKMLHAVSEPLEQVVISIKTLLDLDRISVEEVTGHLRNVEQRKKNTTTIINKQGRLLLTEEKWASWVKNRVNSSKGGGSGSSKGGKKPSKTRSKEDAKLGPDGEPIRCVNYGKKGHWAKDCWPKPKKGKAHVAQTEEEEPSLFLVSTMIQSQFPTDLQSASVDDLLVNSGVNEVSRSDSVELSLGATLEPISTRVDLKEEKVFTHIGERGDNNHRRWILDTGARNHMSGARSTFSEINFGVCGSVKFGDGSVVEIEGRDTIIFLDNTSEHHRLSEVYYIPKLRANIISLGQMEEGGCTIIIKQGVLRILDECDRLLTKVKRTTSHLYILELKVEQSVWPSTKIAEAS